MARTSFSPGAAFALWLSRSVEDERQKRMSGAQPMATRRSEPLLLSLQPNCTDLYYQGRSAYQTNIEHQ